VRVTKAEDTVSVASADAEAAAVDEAAVDAEGEEVDPHPANVISAAIVSNVFFIIIQSPLRFSAS